jgi:integrase/recombinase XerD
MNIYQIIIAIIAAWGAGLSTYTAIKKFREEKPRIKLELSDIPLIYDDPLLLLCILSLEVTNIGKFTITLSSCGIELPSENIFFLESGDGQELPYELEPRKSFCAWMERSDIIKRLESYNFKDDIKISGFCTDTLDNFYTSKTLNFKRKNEEIELSPIKNKIEPLDNEEVNNLTNYCDTFQEKFIIWTLLDTGLRLSEFVDLKKENIQWKEKKLVIYNKSGPYGKKIKRRIIPMTERVRRLIEYHFAENNNTGVSKRTIERIVKRVADKAGITKKVSPHVLRYTFAVNCIKKGISTRALQSLLGHDRFATWE